MESYFFFDGHLVGRDAPLEEIREFLDVLEFHESEGIPEEEAMRRIERIVMEECYAAEAFGTVSGILLKINDGPGLI